MSGFAVLTIGGTLVLALMSLAALLLAAMYGFRRPQ
jgi:hypothetical protein